MAWKVGFDRAFRTVKKERYADNILSEVHNLMVRRERDLRSMHPYHSDQYRPTLVGDESDRDLCPECLLEGLDEKLKSIEELSVSMTFGGPEVGAHLAEVARNLRAHAKGYHSRGSSQILSDSLPECPICLYYYRAFAPVVAQTMYSEEPEFKKARAKSYREVLRAYRAADRALKRALAGEGWEQYENANDYAYQLRTRYEISRTTLELHRMPAVST